MVEPDATALSPFDQLPGHVQQSILEAGQRDTCSTPSSDGDVDALEKEMRGRIADAELPIELSMR